MTDARIKKWLISANNDFRAAENLLSFPKEKIITNVVCYLLQQSGEKFLKAFLFYKNIQFSKTHSLELLLTKARDADKTFPELNLGRLTSYNISMRYPDEFRVPQLAEANESFVIAKSVKETVLTKIQVLEDELTLF